jgi:hypothetical protein
MPRGGEHRLPFLHRTEAFGDAVDIEIGDRMLGKITLGKGLVLRPQPLGNLAHRRARQKPSATLVGEGVLDVARR